MLWGKNKRGEKVGSLVWTRWTLDNDTNALENLRKAAARVADEGGKSLIVLVEVDSLTSPRKER